MTKFRYLAIFSGFLAIEAAHPSLAQGIRIDQLNPAGTLGDSDVVPVEQGGAPPAKKMTLSALKAYLKPYSGPCDVVAKPRAWWGLRACGAANLSGTTKAINIRRVSDNSTTDVVIRTDGSLDTASGSNFCASTTCYVTRLYDQSGNGTDVSQATAANQPLLTFNCLGALPCIQFSGTQRLFSAAITAIPQPLSYSAVAERTGNFTAYNAMISGGGSPYAEMGFNNAANAVYLYAGSVAPTTSATDNIWHSLNGVFNDAANATILNVDGANTSLPSGGGNGTTTELDMGSRYDATNPLTGKIMEVGVWASGLPAGSRSSVSTNQHAAYGF
jgi:hypothetical protein